MESNSEIEVRVHIKYRFKNDLFVGATTVNIAELLRLYNGNIANVDKHMQLYDKNRNQAGAIFLTFNMQVLWEPSYKYVEIVRGAVLSYMTLYGLYHPNSRLSLKQY